jgi:hypothetical protein
MAGESPPLCHQRVLLSALLALRADVALRRLRFKVALRAPSARLRRRGFAFRFAAFVLFARYGGFAAENEITFRLPQFAVLKGRLTLQDCKVHAQGLAVNSA